MNKQEAQARLKELEKEKAELEKVIKAKDDEFPRRGDDYCYLTDEGIRTSTNTNHLLLVSASSVAFSTQKKRRS